LASKPDTIKDVYKFKTCDKYICRYIWTYVRLNTNVGKKLRELMKNFKNSY